MKKILSIVPMLAMGLAKTFSINKHRRSNIIKNIYRYHNMNNDSFDLKSQLKTKFLGITILEYPNDMWYMQEIISSIKPDFIIETGTFMGGSALYYASILQLINPKGKIITIDSEHQVEKALKELQSSPELYERVKKIFKNNIELITSNSIDVKIVKSITQRVRNHKVLVALDSCHAYEHVLQELKLYSPMVSEGSYIVVFDTCVDKIANSLNSKKKKALYDLVLTDEYKKTGGPGKAVSKFLSTNNNFIIDNIEERFFETHLPSEYLKRIK